MATYNIQSGTVELNVPNSSVFMMFYEPQLTINDNRFLEPSPYWNLSGSLNDQIVSKNRFVADKKILSSEDPDQYNSDSLNIPNYTKSIRTRDTLYYLNQNLKPITFAPNYPIIEYSYD